MVGSSLSDEKRSSLQRRLLGAFVLLVAVSGGLVALQSDATVEQVGAASVGGLVVGVVLVWFLVRLSEEIRRQT